jgi:hypothetical protein
MVETPPRLEKSFLETRAPAQQENVAAGIKKKMMRESASRCAKTREEISAAYHPKPNRGGGWQN